MKKISIAFIAITLLFACSEKKSENNLHLTGNIKGLKKGFATIEDVLSNLGGQSTLSSDRNQEVRDEMSSLKDETLLDDAEQFESKSYKSKRFKK